MLNIVRSKLGKKTMDRRQPCIRGDNSSTILIYSEISDEKNQPSEERITETRMLVE